MLKLCSVVVFHRSMVSWRRGALAYVHCAVCETDFGEVVFHTSMVIWKGAHLPWDYVHSAICETY